MYRSYELFHLFADKAYQVEEVSWEGHALQKREVMYTHKSLFRKSWTDYITWEI
jgi:hypothetical protein